jgi:flavodoxin
VKGLVVYDSVFSNTEKVAQAIGKALGSLGEVSTVQVKTVTPDQLAGLDVLVVGSPTRAFKHTEAVGGFIKKIPAGGLKGTKIAAFDTRIAVEETNSGFLKFMVKLFGYAAEPIAAKLVKKGGEPAGQPEGFIVTGTEGPLKEGELDRAAVWAGALLGKYFD